MYITYLHVAKKLWIESDRSKKIETKPLDISQMTGCFGPIDLISAIAHPRFWFVKSKKVQYSKSLNFSHMDPKIMPSYAICSLMLCKKNDTYWNPVNMCIMRPWHMYTSLSDPEKSFNFSHSNVVSCRLNCLPHQAWRWKTQPWYFKPKSHGIMVNSAYFAMVSRSALGSFPVEFMLIQHGNACVSKKSPKADPKLTLTPSAPMN